MCLQIIQHWKGSLLIRRALSAAVCIAHCTLLIVCGWMRLCLVASPMTTCFLGQTVSMYQNLNTQNTNINEVAFSGSYTDLSNTPVISAVGHSGQYRVQNVSKATLTCNIL